MVVWYMNAPVTAAFSLIPMTRNTRVTTTATPETTSAILAQSESFDFTILPESTGFADFGGSRAMSPLEALFSR
jgi:hypothetical protein